MDNSKPNLNLMLKFNNLPDYFIAKNTITKMDLTFNLRIQMENNLMSN